MSVEFSVDTHGIATVTLNRPERLNAMDADAYEALSQAWTRVRDDTDIRVAVVTGAGDKSFTVGADLKSYITAKQELDEFFLSQRDQLLNRGLEVWKPVIAAVNGYCIGGGMTLLMATDIRVAAEHATFGLSEVKRGIFAGNGGTQRLLENLPRAIAMELVLTGDPVDATTAQRWGLVNRVTAAEQVLDTAYEYAHKIARNAPLAVQASKELVLRSRDTDISTGLRIEQAWHRLVSSSQDALEGPQAFAERRQPVFGGR